MWYNVFSIMKGEVVIIGYYPQNIQGDVNMREDRLKECLKIQKYLRDNPNVKEYKGFTGESVANEIQSLKQPIEYLE